MGRITKEPKRVTTSKFQGVTLMKSTNRWRAQKNTQSLGEYDTEEKAAKAFDRASINLYGRTAKLNFALKYYEHEIESITAMSFEEIAQKLRDSAITAAPTSSYRGVSYLTACKKWRAQININNKQYHLGYYGTQEEAAMVFDRASIIRGMDKKKTRLNFEITVYEKELPYIMSVTIEELQRILDDEKVGWKVAKHVLSSGNWVELSEVLGRCLMPKSMGLVQAKMQQLCGQSKQASMQLKRRQSEDQYFGTYGNYGSIYGYNSACVNPDIYNTPSHDVYSQNSSYEEMYPSKRQRINAMQGRVTNLGSVQFNSTPSSGSIVESEAMYPYCGFQTPPTQKIEQQPYNNQQGIYRGKENLQPEDLYLDDIFNDKSSVGRVNNYNGNGYQNNSFGSSYDTYVQPQPANKGKMTANEMLIGLMTQQGFPQETIAVVEDFDTDISQVRHAGAWRILRFMIQYSPQKYDHLDEMWLRLQGLIELVLEQCPAQANPIQS